MVCAQMIEWVKEHISIYEYMKRSYVNNPDVQSGFFYSAAMDKTISQTLMMKIV